MDKIKAQKLDRANIHNLTALWKYMGAETLKGGRKCTRYAATSNINRLWFDWGCEPNAKDISTLIKKALTSKITYTIPSWGEKETPLTKALCAQGFEIASNQTAMCLPLRGLRCDLPKKSQVRTVKTKAEIKKWAELASQLFADPIPPPTLQAMIKDAQFHLVMALHHETLVGCGLGYKTDHIGGIHYLGILPVYRRQGLAGQIMQHLIHWMRIQHCDYATLQASQVGEALYRKLGFARQFQIPYYHRPQNGSL